MKLELLAGEHISKAAEKAIGLVRGGEPRVTFDFNDIEVTVTPGMGVGDVEAEYHRLMEAKRAAQDADPEYQARLRHEAQRREVETRERWLKALAAVGSGTEAELRDAPDPWPQTAEDLNAYVGALATRSHDYGTCVYAMSLAALAAFNYVAHVLGTTGFQSSCADMDIIRRTRHMKHGFMIVDAGNLLYPQYDPLAKVAEFLAKTRATLGPAARELLAQKDSAHPNVRAHWEALAAQPDVSPLEE